MIQKIYNKYDFLFRDIRNSEDTYDLKEAFKLMILSTSVSLKDKETLIRLKKENINEEISLINIKINSISNGKTIAYLKMNISKLDEYILEIDEMFKYRDYSKNLSNAVREKNCIMDDI